MNWPLVSLAKLGQWYGGGTPSKGRDEFWRDGTVPWLSPKDMGPDVLQGTRDHVTELALASSPVKLVGPGSVAVVVRSGILERTLPVAVVPFATTLNQDMKALVPYANVDPRWIAWGLRAMERQVLHSARKAGTTVASVEISRFLQIQLPVPELTEQRRIVAILEEHLSDLASATASAVRAMKGTSVLRAKALAAALEDSRRDADLQLKTVGDLAVVGTGTTPSRSKPRFYLGGTIPWVTSGDLSAGLVTTARQFVTEAALKETSLRIYPPGTLLVAMYGEGKTRGSVAELRIAATINQACAALQLKDPQILDWMRLILAANYSWMRSLASGGVQPNLNLSLVRGITVPIPSRQTRERLLQGQSMVDQGAMRLAEELSQLQVRADSLRQSLLTAAFSGRLTGRSSDRDVIEEATEEKSA